MLSSQPIEYGRPSIRHDGRLLAVGTDRGVVIWDLARAQSSVSCRSGLRGTRLFEASGDLLTNGDLGVCAGRFRSDQDRGVIQIGPPHRLPCRPADCEIAEDRSGRVVAVAYHTDAQVMTPRRRFTVGPLDDFVESPSARTANGWRQAVMRPVAFTSGALRCNGGGQATHRVRRASSLQSRWEMADDGSFAVPALGRRHLERGAPNRRPRSLLFP